MIIFSKKLTFINLCRKKMRVSSIKTKMLLKNNFKIQFVKVFYFNIQKQNYHSKIVTKFL